MSLAGLTPQQKFEEIKFSVLAASYSPPCGVPSPLVGLTSEFGMESGVTLPPNHQHGKFNFFYFSNFTTGHASELCPVESSALLLGFGMGRGVTTTSNHQHQTMNFVILFA